MRILLRAANHDGDVADYEVDGYTEDMVGGGTELVSQLEKLFYEILQEEGIEL